MFIKTGFWISPYNYKKNLWSFNLMIYNITTHVFEGHVNWIDKFGCLKFYQINLIGSRKVPREALTRKIPRGGLPCPFSKNGKCVLISGEKCPDYGHIWVNFSFKMQFLRVSRQKDHRFFPCGAFLSCVVGQCLWKCLYSKKTLLP